MKQFFETTKDPEQIIENLTLVHGRAILPQSTLIIFDEIQECNDALNSLKYFCEDAPGYVIACAGSFLAVTDQDLFRYTESIDKFKPVPDIFGSEFTWVVDPLDGTSNFAAGIPWFGVLIAVLKGEVPVMGGAFLPVGDILYVAERGRGAFRSCGYRAGGDC